MKKRIITITLCAVLLLAVNLFAGNTTEELALASSTPSSAPAVPPTSARYYPITVSPEPEGGTVFVDHRRAQKGETIIVTATPDEGNSLLSITVTDAEEKTVTLTPAENGAYSFTMPQARVIVCVEFSGTTGSGPNVPAEPNPLYNDVKESDEFYDAIKFVTEKKLMTGISADGFGPTKLVSRAMFVTVLYRAEGEPNVSIENTFTDVAKGSIYEKPILWAKESGLVNGYSETSFGPDDYVTRQQAAAIIHRYAQVKGYDVSVGENTNILSYEDVSEVAEYAIAAFQYVLGADIMPEKSAAVIKPNSFVARAEFAEMLKRFFSIS